MAAKIAASPDLTLAVGLAEVQPALEAWRQRRRHREAIPENLWRLIGGLAQSHGVNPVARALRLNYAALRPEPYTRKMRPRLLIPRQASLPEWTSLLFYAGKYSRLNSSAT